MTPLLMLPGMMCDARLYAHQLAQFSAERAIHVAPIGDHDTIAAIAGQVLQQAPRLFALCGLSMGGIVAMEIQRQAPDRVAGLALLDTNPSAEREEVRLRRGPQIKKVQAGGLEAVMREEMKPNYLADSQSRQDILDLCASMAQAIGSDSFVRQSTALRDRADQCETLRQVASPVLVLCGEQDLLCPVERHELMHGLIPHSHLEVVAGAGHLPVIEQPEKTNRCIQNWLKRVDAA